MIKEKKEECDEEMGSLAGFDRTQFGRSGAPRMDGSAEKWTGRMAVFVCLSEPGSISSFTHRGTTSSARLTSCSFSPLTPENSSGAGKDNLTLK